MQANSLLAKAIRFVLISSAGLATVVVGAANAADDNGDSKVERIQVTGSRIKRTDLESANPVTVIDASDLANQGFTNVQDALENLSATTGAVTTQSVHGFTPAATAISLRGAGASRTLTLINGKRLNQYPRALNGTDNFVDTSTIPLDAVARIEVLQSGASAIYGADAVGGVVNIILKRDFNGFSAKYRRGDTSEGGGGNDRVSIAMGSSSDRGNVSNFTEFTSNEQLKATERENFGLNTDKVPYSALSRYSSYGARIAANTTGAMGQRALSPEECSALGLFYDVGNSRCGYDRSRQRDLAPESNRFTNTTLFNYELMNDLTLVGRVDFSKAKSTTRIEPSSTDGVKVNVNGDALSLAAYGLTKQYADKATALGGDFANATDGDYTYIRRLNGLGQRTGETNAENYYGSLGLEGTLKDDYSWDVSGNYGKSYIDVYNHGYTTNQKVYDYVTSGANGMSLLNDISSDALNTMSYSPYSRASSSLLNFQANITGPVFTLNNGNDVEFAFGGEWSKQDYTANSDSESMAGNVVGTGGSSGEGERRFWATYGELKAPVLDKLVFDFAARYDRYSDFGGNVTPSIAVEYRPVDELLLRGSWNRVFRAPDMQRVYGNPTDGFGTVVDFKRCEELGGTPNQPNSDPMINEVCNELHINTTTGANPDLKPEKGYTANIGAVYGGEQLNASLDLWQWKLDGMVNDVSPSRQAREYNTYDSTITRDANGTITHINSTALNLSFTQVRGIDSEIGYNFDLNNLGELKLIGRSTYLLKSESQLDTVSPVDDDIDDGGLPRLKGNVVATWKISDYSTTLSGYYTARHHGINYKSIKETAAKDDKINFNESDNEVGSYVKWNLTGTYHMSDDIQFQTGVINLFDKGPNFDPTNSSWPHYERSLFNARGREWFVEASMKM